MSRSILNTNPWKWVPNRWSSLITLLLFPLFVYLGFWQLHRMEIKQNLENQRKFAMLAPPINLQELKSRLLISKRVNSAEKPEMLIAKLFTYHQLTLLGTFLSHQNILLDNQIFKGQPGYRVLTPFQPDGSDSLVLVDRGFIPWGQNRNKLPLVNAPQHWISISGTVTQLSHGLLLKEEPLSRECAWPLQIQRVDYVTLSKQLGQSLYPFLLQLPAESPHVFQTIPLSLGLSPTRHLGYAFQWFTMALAILIYYVFCHIRRR